MVSLRDDLLIFYFPPVEFEILKWVNFLLILGKKCLEGKSEKTNSPFTLSTIKTRRIRILDSAEFE